MYKLILPSILEQISIGDISRAQAAVRLGVSTRTVNREMKKAGVERPEPGYKKRRHIAKTRREFKESMKGHAKALSIDALMEKAGISRRTAYRWKYGQ